jgi:hypothetical protein
VAIPPRLAVTLAVAAAAALTALVAVTRSGAAPETPEPRETPALVLPFDAYAFSELDTHTIESAEDVLIAACMREQGLGWTALPLPSARHATPPNRLRYGLTDTEQAARHGYHLPSATPAQERRAAVWRARDALPRREHRAAFGDSGTGGCWGRAHAHLLRDVPPDNSSLLARYTREAFDAARQAPEVTAVLDAWSACMERAGHDYADPLQSFGDPAWDTPRPAARELAVAEADTRCKAETDLVAVWSGAEERAQRRVVRDHPEDFQALADRKESWLHAARETLEDR